MIKDRDLPRLELKPDSSGRQQVGIWRENVSSLWDISVEAEDEGRFNGTSNVYHLGTSILGQTRVSGHKLRRAPALIARMGVDHVIVQYREVGRLVGDADGRAFNAEVGDICFFDMSRPLQALSTDYVNVTLAIPRSLFASFSSDPDALHGTVIRASSPLGAIALAHLRTLNGQARRLSPLDAVAAIEGTAALLAVCAVRGAAAIDGMRTTAEPIALVALRQFIELNLSSPGLTADALARRFGLSRSALYRAFAPHGGIARYIRRRRLACAYRELARIDGRELPRVQDVARRWQFESATNFAHAFRREFDMTPGDVRERALTGLATPVGLPAEKESYTELYQWVLDLTA